MPPHGRIASRRSRWGATMAEEVLSNIHDVKVGFEDCDLSGKKGSAMQREEGSSDISRRLYMP
jgi:hypothetical protein